MDESGVALEDDAALVEHVDPVAVSDMSEGVSGEQHCFVAFAEVD